MNEKRPDAGKTSERSPSGQDARLALIVREGTYDEANDGACRDRGEDRIPAVIIACPVIAGRRGIQAVLVVITDIHGAGVRTVIAANPVRRDVACAIVRASRVAIGGIATIIARWGRIITTWRRTIGIARRMIVVAVIASMVTAVVMTVTAIIATITTIVSTITTIMSTVTPVVPTVATIIPTTIPAPVTMTAARIGARDGSDGQASNGEGREGFSECVHQFHGRLSLR
jgi:glycerol-3-phosphate acyltransferase PlsY